MLQKRYISAYTFQNLKKKIALCIMHTILQLHQSVFMISICVPSFLSLNLIYDLNTISFDGTLLFSPSVVHARCFSIYVQRDAFFSVFCIDYVQCTWQRRCARELAEWVSYVAVGHISPFISPCTVNRITLDVYYVPIVDPV